MAVPDPIPSVRAAARAQFWRIFRLLVLLSAAVAAIAVLLVSSGDSSLHIHMLIATGLGIFMTMLVGTGLMTLAFISNSSGHDQAAASFTKEDTKE